MGMPPVAVSVCVVFCLVIFNNKNLNLKFTGMNVIIISYSKLNHFQYISKHLKPE